MTENDDGDKLLRELYADAMRARNPPLIGSEQPIRGGFGYTPAPLSFRARIAPIWPYVFWIGAIVLVTAFVFSLLYAIADGERRVLAEFRDHCIAAGETPAKCDLYVELKRSSDNAAIAASAAAGIAAGSAGSRR